MMKTRMPRVYEKGRSMTQHRLLCALLMVCGLGITGVTRAVAAESPEQLGAACEITGSSINTQLSRQRDAITQSCAALLRSASPPRVDTEEFVRIACHLLHNNYLHT